MGAAAVGPERQRAHRGRGRRTRRRRAAVRVEVRRPGRPAGARGRGDARVTLVGHSGAGYLLPQLGTTRRAAPRAGGGYVFLDAGRAARAGDQPAGPDARRGHRTWPTSWRPCSPAAACSRTWTDDDLRELVPDDAARGSLVAGLRRARRGLLRRATAVSRRTGRTRRAASSSSRPAYDGPARVAGLARLAVPARRRTTSRAATSRPWPPRKVVTTASPARRLVAASF